jgi:hypothetical protein
MLQLVELAIGLASGVVLLGWLWGLVFALSLPIALLVLHFLAAMLIVKPLTQRWPTGGRTSAIQRVAYTATACAAALLATLLWLPSLTWPVMACVVLELWSALNDARRLI